MGSGVTIQSAGPQLDGYVSRSQSAGDARSSTGRPGLILCHGFPTTIDTARDDGSFAKLADRVTAESGWSALTFSCRGIGRSEGDFSMSGWLADIRSAIDFMLEVEQSSGVWLAGFGTGGSVAICATGEDERVRGVAALGAPADFHAWTEDPPRFLSVAKEVGAIRTAGFPPDVDSWTLEILETRPLQLIGKIPPRPVLIVHGMDDPLTSPVDARALADAAEEQVELRLIAGAGAGLRHDPRAVAVLLGWLDRQAV